MKMYVFTQGKLRNCVVANTTYLKTNERKIQVFMKSLLTEVYTTYQNTWMHLLSML